MDNEPIGLFEDLETGLLCVVKRVGCFVLFVRILAVLYLIQFIATRLQCHLFVHVSL